MCARPLAGLLQRVMQMLTDKAHLQEIQATGSKIIIVIEDTEASRIVATGSLLLDMKFTRNLGTVSAFDFI